MCNLGVLGPFHQFLGEGPPILIEQKQNCFELLRAKEMGLSRVIEFQTFYFSHVSLTSPVLQVLGMRIFDVSLKSEPKCPSLIPMYSHFLKDKIEFCTKQECPLRIFM